MPFDGLLLAATSPRAARLPSLPATFSATSTTDSLLRLYSSRFVPCRHLPVWFLRTMLFLRYSRSIYGLVVRVPAFAGYYAPLRVPFLLRSSLYAPAVTFRALPRLRRAFRYARAFCWLHTRAHCRSFAADIRLPFADALYRYRLLHTVSLRIQFVTQRPRLPPRRAFYPLRLFARAPAVLRRFCRLGSRAVTLAVAVDTCCQLIDARALSCSLRRCG